MELANQVGMETGVGDHLGTSGDTMVGPAIGLPRLPVIEFPAGLHPLPGRPFTWKYGPVSRYAAGRPLAWLDDDFDVYPAARKTFEKRRRAAQLSTELVTVNPRTGITDDHLAAVAAWARSL